MLYGYKAYAPMIYPTPSITAGTCEERLNWTSVVRIADLRIQIKCQGCKRAVLEVDQQSTRKLRGWEGEWHVPRAFECSRCEVIIFEDEFEGGMFVPPQFRVESTLPGVAEGILILNFDSHPGVSLGDAPETW